MTEPLNAADVLAEGERLADQIAPGEAEAIRMMLECGCHPDLRAFFRRVIAMVDRAGPGWARPDRYIDKRAELDRLRDVLDDIVYAETLADAQNLALAALDERAILPAEAGDTE